MPAVACPCEVCLAQGHPSAKPGTGSLPCQAGSPHHSYWGTEWAQGRPPAQRRGTEHGCDSSVGLGSQSWRSSADSDSGQAALLQPSPLPALHCFPLTLHQDGVSLQHFSRFFKRDCSGFSPAVRGPDELRPGSTGNALSRQSPQHPPLTKTFLFPLVNSLKASMTCSFVRVFLKSRFTVPSSFLKRRDSGEWDGEKGVGAGVVFLQPCMLPSRMGAAFLAAEGSVCGAGVSKGSRSLLAHPKLSHSPDAFTSTANGTPHHQTPAEVAGNVDKLSLTDLVLAANKRLETTCFWCFCAQMASHGCCG